MTSRSPYLKTSRQKDHIFTDDGDLVLRATRNHDGSYTTARSLTTVDRMSFRYGYVEMRAMVPFRAVVWPSFWMQPDKAVMQADIVSEVDIFEVFGSSRYLYANLHKWFDGYSGHAVIGQNGNTTGNPSYRFADNTGLCYTYHTYGLEWTEERMSFYVDGDCFYSVSIKEADDFYPDRPGMDCFRDYHYLCWNLWMYADEIKEGVLQVPDTVDYRIDYIRLYQDPKTEFLIVY